MPEGNLKLTAGTGRKPDGPAFPSHIRTQFVLVTPADAQRYLSEMHTNRSKSKLEIGIQEENLKDGTFYPGISPVYFDGGDPPRAWDGQHRFEAIVSTGVAAYLLFIYGVTEEEADYIDTGRKRTYSDSLRRTDVPDYKRQSVLARYMALYDKYGIEGIRQPGRYPVTLAQKNLWLDHPGCHPSIKLGEAMYRAVGANPSYAAYAAMRTGEMRPDGTFDPDPDGFWNQVRTGAELTRNDPALTLHNYLMQGRKRDRTPADKRLMELYVLGTGWNKHVAGQDYARVAPKFDRRQDGSLFFPASSVPDFLPRDAGLKGLRQLKEAQAALRRARGQA